MSSRSAFRIRCIAGTATLCLVAAACGGADSGGATGEGGSSASPVPAGSNNSDSSDTESSGGGDDIVVAGPQRSSGDIVEFDSTALPITALDLAVLNYSERQLAAPSVQPLVETCAVLPASVADDIANGLGQSVAFTATTRGAACDYKSDTHFITLLIGSSAEVPSDPLANDAFLPAGAGEVSTTPWATDSSIVILSEDSFDLDTPYGALTTDGEYGVRVDNTGGTGIDPRSDGELFAQLVAAAVANVGAAPPPAAGGDDSALPAGDPCSFWTQAELEAFFMGTPFGEPTQLEGPNSCRWDGWDRNGASLSAQIFGGGNEYSFDSMEAVGSTGAVYTFIGGGLPIIISPDGVAQVTLRIDMLDGSIPDDAVIALAENLAMRLG